MTDGNVISIAITLFAIAASSLFNNVRISDLAISTHKRFDAQRDFIRSEISRINQKLDRVPPQRSPKTGQWWSPENRPMRT